MKVIAINGSPRRQGNTFTLLQKALEGAISTGAEGKMIHLYDYSYQGCRSCFACKRKTPITCCIMEDDLKPVLQELLTCDVLLLGSPIYLGNISGLMKSFFERLIFMNLSYDCPERTNFKGKIHSGFIYTMGLTKEQISSFGYAYIFETNKDYLQLLHGQSTYMISSDSYQFDDYTAYAASNFDAEHKAFIHSTVFLKDMKYAYDLGKNLAMLK